MRDSIGARTRAPSPGGEPGIHIPEARVHGFRALGFAEPRNDEISDADNGGSAMSAGAEKVGVVGAGLMGAEIALVFALAGHDVLLSDRGEAELKTALERLARVLDRGIGRGFYKEEEKPAALARIRTTTALEEFADRDVVTEAVFRRAQVQGEVHRPLARICRPRSTRPSNASTIPSSTCASYVG